MDAGRRELRRLSERARDVLLPDGSGQCVSERAAYGWFIHLAALRWVRARDTSAGRIDSAAKAVVTMTAAGRLLPEFFATVPTSLRAMSRRSAAGEVVDVLWNHDHREAIDAAMRDPRALGWLHQFWMNRDKGRVAAEQRKKSGHKIAGADLVAATCIYTSDDHTRFLLQNSLGRVWLGGRKRSKAAKGWEYLVESGGAAKGKPARDITAFDPACGSGNFLLEAFEMLVAMHREEEPGRDAASIGREVLARNLFGLDIDPRAVRIARAALAMRCRELCGVWPRAMRVECASGKGAVLGALARPEGRSRTGVEALLKRKYTVVATNPPFVGFRKLSPTIKAGITKLDPLASSDLATAFVSRGFGMLEVGGMLAVVTPAAWLTSRPALPLRKLMLEEVGGGGPRVVAQLGQRVFETAPLLFVSLAVVGRGDCNAVAVVSVKKGGTLAQAAKAARSVPMSQVRSDAGCSFTPSAAVLPVHRRGEFALTGDLVTFADGLWTGDNARDTRDVGEVAPDDPEWFPAAGGLGYCRWYGPVVRMVRTSAALKWAHLERREGCLEYSRVAGGKLAARMVLTRSAAIAGVVSMFPRPGMENRLLDVLAVFNSRVGTLWLRSLTSGLNFNPGYAARVPVAELSEGLRALVREAVRLKQELAAGGSVELEARLSQVERQIDRQVAQAMGFRKRDLESVVLPIRSRRQRGIMGELAKM